MVPEQVIEEGLEVRKALLLKTQPAETCLLCSFYLQVVLPNHQ